MINHRKIQLFFCEISKKFTLFSTNHNVKAGLSFGTARLVFFADGRTASSARTNVPRRVTACRDRGRIATPLRRADYWPDALRYAAALSP